MRRTTSSFSDSTCAAGGRRRAGRQAGAWASGQRLHQLGSRGGAYLPASTPKPTGACFLHTDGHCCQPSLAAHLAGKRHHGSVAHGAHQAESDGVRLARHSALRCSWAGRVHALRGGGHAGMPAVGGWMCWAGGRDGRVQRAACCNGSSTRSGSQQWQQQHASGRQRQQRAPATRPA